MSKHIKVIHILPKGAPRVNRNSRWTPKAKKYEAYKAELRRQWGDKPLHAAVELRFFFVPPVYPPGHEREGEIKDQYTHRVGKPHQFKPDIDNLEKGVLDALCPGGDQYVYRVIKEKRWGVENIIEIKELE